jgi:hypothetical protein
MNDNGKSDKLIVPTRVTNKRRLSMCSAERLEGRGLAKENVNTEIRMPDMILLASRERGGQVMFVRGIFPHGFRDKYKYANYRGGFQDAR